MTHKQNTNKDQGKIKLLIFMERNFADFDSQQRDLFLSDLANISGASLENITNVSFRRGCVEFRGKLPKEAMRRVVEYYKRIESEEESDELDAFRRFLDKHGVEFINTIIDSEGRVSVVNTIVTKLEEPEIPSIVFIHGWQGGNDSFGVLPKYLSENLGYRSYIYDYPTDAFSHSPSIVYISRNLENWIRNNIDSYRFAIISHSMGGVVTRKMLVNQNIRDYPLDERIGQVTFIASPHSGAALANVATKIPLLRKAQLEEIKSSSSFMFELSEYWSYWVSQNVPENCSVRSIFGTKDNIVSEMSAKGLDNNAIPVLGASHSDIVKPSSKTDEIVVTLSRLIREAKLKNNDP